MSKRGSLPIIPDTFSAEADMSSYEYVIVVHGTAANQCKMPAAAKAGKILGVMENKPESGIGASCNVIILGLAKVTLAGTVAHGDNLEIAGTTGRAQKYTDGEANGCLGKAMESGVTGDIITAYVCPVDYSSILT